MNALRAALEGLVNRWAVGGNGIDAQARDLISACSAELLRVLDEHPEQAEQAAGAARYALVEQMGHRSTVAAVREVTFCGAPMLELTSLNDGSVHLASPGSLYEVTWLTEEQARTRARPWTAHAITAGQQLAYDEDAEADELDDDESAREMAEEGNAVAMSGAERDEYDRDSEAWLDAQDEADADEDGDL